MKIVQINAVYGYSSTGRTTKEVHLELMNQGHEAYVFCTNYENETENVYCMGTNVSRKIHGLMSRITGLQGYFSFKATKQLLKKLNYIKPDVVCLRNLHGNYIHVNMLLNYLIKWQISTVIILHDCWLFTGHCCHFIEYNCYRWQQDCGECPAKHKWNNSWFFDRSKKVLCDRRKRFTQLKRLTVIGVSDWVMNECKKSFMKKNAKFLRIYNWIDLDMFTPTKRTKKQTPRVLSVAHAWSDIKGLSDIIDVAKENPTYEFIMVGKMPGNIELPDNINAMGIINDMHELCNQYQNADILLHLSYQETFGKVIVEAMACGVPAIVYNVTAMPELIRKECGRVVEKGDWRSASKALQEIFESGVNHNEIRKFVEENFSKEILIEKTVDAILKTVSDTNGENICSGIY